MRANGKNYGIMGIFCVLLSLGLTVQPALANQSGLQIPHEVTGDVAYDHVFYLSETIGPRVVGTAKELETADYIAEQFEDMGYDVEIQPFTFERGGATFESQNIIATKEGENDRTVIVGAHYDSVAAVTCNYNGQIMTSTGAGDNASGVGVMLEVAQVLANCGTEGTIKFVAFGSGEIGLNGSYYYAEQMTAADIENTAAMVDLDAVGAGDYFYVYAGLDDNPGWARDLALTIGQQMGHNLRTSPASDCFEYGTTGDWSDHLPFRLLDIPIAFFEWMNWDIEPCGGIETEDHGWIMHTCRDNLSFVLHDKLEKTAEVVASLTIQLLGPAGRINEIIDYFDESVENGGIVGDGNGNSANNRLNAFGNMLDVAQAYIDAGDFTAACEQLEAILGKCDGESPPPDFVVGDDAAAMAASIQALMDTLGCE